MKTKWLLAKLLLVALILAGCASRPKEFRSAAGKFSVEAPIPLKEQVQPIDTPAGKIDAHIFMAESKTIAYVVAYADYPEQVVSQSNPELVLNGARDGMVGNVNGKLVLETRITINNYPGREVVVDVKMPDGKDGTVKARLYLVKNRLYQVEVVTTKGEVAITTINSFLDSFKLIGE